MQKDEINIAYFNRGKLRLMEKIEIFGIEIDLTLWNGLLAILAFRVLQRLYYFVKGHTHFGFDFDPRKRLESFFSDNGILVSDHSFVSKHDDVTIRYRRIGNGKKRVLLSNGVGTDLFMWLPVLRNMHRLNPTIFTGEQGMTLLAPCFRGLFNSHKVNRTVEGIVGKGVAENKEKMSMKRSDSFSDDSNITLRDKKYDDEIEVTITTLAHDLVDVFHHFDDENKKKAKSSTSDGKHEDATPTMTERPSPTNDASKEYSRRESHFNTWADAGYDQYDIVMGWSLGKLSPLLLPRLLLLR